MGNESDISRRRFLGQLAGLTVLGACSAPGEAIKPIEPVKDNTKTRVDGIFTPAPESPETQEDSINSRINCESDMASIQEIYNSEGGDLDFFSWIQKRQAEWGLPKTGTIDNDTLRKFYKSYNSYFLAAQTQLSRIMIQGELQDFFSNPSLPRKPLGSLDPFDNQKFFGGISPDDMPDFFPIEGTFIAQGLSEYLQTEGQPNSAHIFKQSDGRAIFLFYNENGKLEIATFISYGTPDHESPEDIGYGLFEVDLNHVSASYPEEGGAGAPMFAATKVTPNDGIWIHSSADKIDGYPHSHGCFRMGLYYARYVYERVRKKTTPISLKIGKLY